MKFRFIPLCSKQEDSSASSGGKGAEGPAGAAKAPAGVSPAADLKAGVFVTLVLPSGKQVPGFRDPVYGFRDEAGGPLEEQPTGFIA